MTKRTNLSTELAVDWAACKGHGLCAELLPELIQLDEWGYPILAGPVPIDLEKHARRAVSACPALALRLSRVRSHQNAGGRGQP